MLNFIPYSDIFGYNITQLVAVPFPCQFPVYNYIEALVIQNKHNSILFYKFLKESAVKYY